MKCIISIIFYFKIFVILYVAGKNQTSGCFTTTLNPTLNNQIKSSSAISVLPTPLSITSQFPCPLARNEYNDMDEFVSEACVDSSDLEVFHEDIGMMKENDQQSLSANLPASLHLANSNSMITLNAADQENMSDDSLDRISKSLIDDLASYSENDHH